MIIDLFTLDPETLVETDIFVKVINFWGKYFNLITTKAIGAYLNMFLLTQEIERGKIEVV